MWLDVNEVRGELKIKETNYLIAKGAAIPHYRVEKLSRFKRDEKANSILNVNLCDLKKFFDTIGRSDLSEILRSRVSKIYSQCTTSGRTEFFKDPIKVINRLQNDSHKCIATLMYLTGARIGDIKKIRADMIGKQIFIPNSKGGRSRILDFSDREEALIIIDQLCRELQTIHIPSSGWQRLRENYYKDLRQTAQACGEIYTGVHAFRAIFAHERREELIDSSILEKGADQTVSEEL